MARPRKDSGEADARTRIIEAFWQLLAKEGHVSRVSAGAVATAAGCNRGTFYYYFKSVNDLVDQALRETLTRDGRIVDALFRVMATGDLCVFGSVDLVCDLHRIVVGLGSGVAYELNDIIRRAVVERWEQALYAGGRQLTSDACFMVQFMLSGVMSYLLAMAHANERAGAGLLHPRPPASYAHAYAEGAAAHTIESVAQAEGIDPEEAARLMLAAIAPYAENIATSAEQPLTSS